MKLTPEEREALTYLVPSPVFQRFLGWLNRMAEEEVQRLVKSDENVDVGRGRVQMIYRIFDTVTEISKTQQKGKSNGTQRGPSLGP